MSVPGPSAESATGFCANQARFTINKEGQKILAADQLLNHLTAVLTNEVKLNKMFCDINANPRILHFVDPSVLRELMYPDVAHCDAVSL